MNTEPTEPLLDRLVAEYSDELAAGRRPDPERYAAHLPEAQRATLRKCLEMIGAGLARATSGSAALAPGHVLDGFRIQRVLGRGGMATVYLAEELELQRTVALKVLKPDLALSPAHVERFRREALAIARIHHPHILQVHRVGHADGLHYIAMERVDGPNLAQVLDALPREGERTRDDLVRACGGAAVGTPDLTFEQAFVTLLVPVARAIAVAHELGLVHRDVKPSNILLHRDGRPVVADFGLAKDEADPSLSLTADLLGTPFYMAPEQVVRRKHRVDGRSDVYSLGVVLFEGLTGRRPFEGETLYDVFEAIQNRPAPPLRSLAPHLSRDVQAVVTKALEKDPQRRYGSALELASDLEHLAHRRPTQARAQEGGVWRRMTLALERSRTPDGLDYRSERSFLGLPLVHIAYGHHPGGRPRVAKGWIAVGQIAIGGLTLGGLSCGAFAIGGMTLGALAFGGMASGLVAIGGMTLALLAFGGLAIGAIALGGQAIGYYALGGEATGVFPLDHGTAHPEAVRFFTDWAPWLLRMFGLDA